MCDLVLELAASIFGLTAIGEVPQLRDRRHVFSFTDNTVAMSVMHRRPAGDAADDGTPQGMVARERLQRGASKASVWANWVSRAGGPAEVELHLQRQALRASVCSFSRFTIGLANAFP